MGKLALKRTVEERPAETHGAAIAEVGFKSSGVNFLALGGPSTETVSVLAAVVEAGRVPGRVCVCQP